MFLPPHTALFIVLHSSAPVNLTTMAPLLTTFMEAVMVDGRLDDKLRETAIRRFLEEITIGRAMYPIVDNFYGARTTRVNPRPIDKTHVKHLAEALEHAGTVYTGEDKCIPAALDPAWLATVPHSKILANGEILEPLPALQLTRDGAAEAVKSGWDIYGGNHRIEAVKIVNKRAQETIKKAQEKIAKQMAKAEDVRDNDLVAAQETIIREKKELGAAVKDWPLIIYDRSEPSIE